MSSLENKLEALLFYRGEAETRTYLAKVLEVPAADLETAISSLTATLATRGLRVLCIGEQVELVTAPETSDVVTRSRKQELTRDLGKAGAETLAIILYRGPLARADIEYIRGVNCAFILRNLLIRGLVERVPNPKNARSVLYQATPDLLKHLGITAVSDLPDEQAVRAELEAFEEENDTDDALRAGGEPHGATDTETEAAPQPETNI